MHYNISLRNFESGSYLFIQDALWKTNELEKRQRQYADLPASIMGIVGGTLDYIRLVPRMQPAGKKFSKASPSIASRNASVRFRLKSASNGSRIWGADTTTEDWTRPQLILELGSAGGMHPVEIKQFCN